MNRSDTLPLSHTKLTVPGRRPEIVSRARLLKKLDVLLDKHLFLITAPAGYGKTSFLIDLAQYTSMPACWLSLDDLDREPQRFLNYFTAAISRNFPRFGTRSRAAITDLTEMEGALENLVVTFANEIYEKIDEHFILILDDYHIIDTVPAIRNFVSRFVQLSPENCHLILASRRLPTLPDMPILVARQQVSGFDLTELAFRPDEIQLLFEKNYNVALTEEETDELLRRTEGWITGLHLSRMGDSSTIPDLSHTARAVGIDLTDYFEQQVLNQQAVDVRAFLLQTSLLDEFNPALCDAVLGVGDWQKMMQKVRRNNLFVLPVGRQGEWIRYHALFREFLRKRIQQESPAVLQAILLRYAQVSEENGDWEKAHYAILQTGDLFALAAFLERIGPALIENDRILTLSSWLEELPASMIQNNAALLSKEGYIALAKGQVHFAVEQIERSQKMFREQGDLTGLAFTLVLSSWVNCLKGEYRTAISFADEVINLTKDVAGAESRLAEAYRMKGLALFRVGEIRQASDCFENSLGIYVHLGAEKNIPQVQIELGMTRRVLGNVASSRSYYEKALETLQKQGRHAVQATLLNNLGVLHHSCGEYDDAAKCFEQGLSSARSNGYVRSESLILVSLGDLYADISDLEGAQEIYQRAYAIAVETNDHFLTNYTRVALAGIARQTRDYPYAWLLLDDAGAAIQQGGSFYEIGIHALEKGRLHLSEGSTQRAIPSLQSALETFEKGSRRTEAICSRLWLAAAQVAVGNMQMGREMVESSLSLQDSEELAPSLLPTGLQLRGWLARLRESSTLHLDAFLKQVDDFQQKLPPLRRRLRRQTSVVPNLAPDIVIRAFGKAQVRIKGHLITNAQWKTRSVRELFFLFVHAPKPLTKEKIGDMLWPGYDPEFMKARFKNELYRLRRALGQEVILFEEDAYQFNRNLDIEYDVDIFESCLARARSAKSPEEKLHVYQEAVAVVRGPYLEDIDLTWPIIDRERYQQQYLSTLLSISELLLERGEIDAPLKTCQYVLAADKYNEAAYCLIMRIHAARGDRLAVIRQYQTCRDVLEQELGVHPDTRTEVLYRQLTS